MRPIASSQLMRRNPRAPFSRTKGNGTRPRRRSAPLSSPRRGSTSSRTAGSRAGMVLRRSRLSRVMHRCVPSIVQSRSAGGAERAAVADALAAAHSRRRAGCRRSRHRPSPCRESVAAWWRRDRTGSSPSRNGSCRSRASCNALASAPEPAFEAPCFYEPSNSRNPSNRPGAHSDPKAGAPSNSSPVR